MKTAIGKLISKFTEVARQNPNTWKHFIQGILSKNKIEFENKDLDPETIQ